MTTVEELHEKAVMTPSLEERKFFYRAEAELDAKTKALEELTKITYWFLLVMKPSALKSHIEEKTEAARKALGK